jgi:hypothetical protein
MMEILFPMQFYDESYNINIRLIEISKWVNISI